MLNEKRNVALQAKVKFARHNGAQAPLKVVLTSIEKGRHHFIRAIISLIYIVSFRQGIYIISFASFTLFNIILAHANEEAKNARGKE